MELDSFINLSLNFILYKTCSMILPPKEKNNLSPTEADI